VFNDQKRDQTRHVSQFDESRIDQARTRLRTEESKGRCVINLSRELFTKLSYIKREILNNAHVSRRIKARTAMSISESHPET